jgi:hypothetical protein
MRDCQGRSGIIRPAGSARLGRAAQPAVQQLAALLDDATLRRVADWLERTREAALQQAAGRPQRPPTAVPGPTAGPSAPDPAQPPPSGLQDRPAQPPAPARAGRLPRRLGSRLPKRLASCLPRRLAAGSFTATGSLWLVRGWIGGTHRADIPPGAPGLACVGVGVGERWVGGWSVSDGTLRWPLFRVRLVAAARLGEWGRRPGGSEGVGPAVVGAWSGASGRGLARRGPAAVGIGFVHVGVLRFSHATCEWVGWCQRVERQQLGHGRRVVDLDSFPGRSMDHGCHWLTKPVSRSADYG